MPVQTAFIHAMQTIKTLDLNLLKALNALLDERNVTRAAEKLSISQPAMSGMLTRLRDSFNDPLFIRTQHGILPTDRALGLAIPVKQILDQAQGLLTEPEFDPARAELKINIAASDYAMCTIITPLLSILHHQAPNIQINVALLNPRSMQEDLERGKLDFVLATPGQAPDNLHVRILFDDHYVCAVRTGHPILQQDRQPDLTAFRILQHVTASSEDNAYNNTPARVLDDLGLNRRVSVQSALVLPDIVRHSNLCALIPYRLIAEHADISHFTPPVDITGFSNALVWHERTHRNPAHQWLRDLMAKSCQSIEGRLKPIFQTAFD
ncbi:LysR family transcriptional regulator [Neisseria yangbaofengii]|uniref:LysR family transcriptional regulator n=1 Tax=Neisseria yangbaofengii TaxID=2709396 RepID=UPI0019802B0B|nr:LysR family transcriptional regulator [Neisseria yangbaofengii]